ncbi:quinoprotein relay system zinc metallohydrolase 2 [Hyphomicrobium sp. CS1GBMeth3]|uniref:quinoprotein relay system zinc metallohydrolase 2 n=1 Tax=Hyphomicrobium sp. CS1GBMeth3 TaxID=1892845 RepID=UPI0009311AD9|nr:quinoprotein relay system zinc metallohydrolase 2 [Hyphomicrobium sp. CS1GBMeth3]
MTLSNARIAALQRRTFLAAALASVVAPALRPVRAWASSELAVTEIAPGVFVHQGLYEEQSPKNRGDIANAGFIVGREAVAVIDTLGSFKVGQELRAAIRRHTDKPIRYVINTHMHPDHVLGNAAFKEDQPAFVGHFKLERALAMRSESYLATNRTLLGDEAFAGTEIVLPTVSVQDRQTIDLGGRSLVLEAQKTAHTDNDLIVTDTTTDTLFMGDLLFSVHVPTIDGSITGWLALLDKIAARKAARVVPGHGPHAMPFPDALAPQKRYLATVADDVRKLIRDNKTLSEASKTAGLSERGNWQLFDSYHVRNVTTAFAELEWE